MTPISFDGCFSDAEPNAPHWLNQQQFAANRPLFDRRHSHQFWFCCSVSTVEAPGHLWKEDSDSPRSTIGFETSSRENGSENERTLARRESQSVTLEGGLDRRLVFFLPKGCILRFIAGKAPLLGSCTCRAGTYTGRHTPGHSFDMGTFDWSTFPCSCSHSFQRAEVRSHPAAASQTAPCSTWSPRLSGSPSSPIWASAGSPSPPATAPLANATALLHSPYSA